MDMCFFRPKFALINQVSFPPGNKMRYDMLKEHGNTNMFLHDLDGFFYLYQQRFLTTLRDSLLNMCKPWIVNICGVLVMKLNSRETRANKILHWNRFETWVTEYFLKRRMGRQHCLLTICIELVELTVSDDKIQITILILRRGTLSSQLIGGSNLDSGVHTCL